MVSALAVLIVLGTVFAIMLGGRAHRFRPGLARTRVRKVSGPNFATMLAVLAIAALLVEAGSLPVLSTVPSVAPLLAALAVVLIIGVVVGRGITEVIIGLLAVLVLGMTVGVSGTPTLIVLTAVMLWLLTVVRGWMA
jgi:hypothetical protein